MQNKKPHHLKYIDIKSLAIGVLLTLCIVLAAGAAQNNQNDPGPYQCCAAGDDTLGVFVINTQTGHTWKLGRASIYDFGTPQAPRSRRSDLTPFVD